MSTTNQALLAMLEGKRKLASIARCLRKPQYAVQLALAEAEAKGWVKATKAGLLTLTTKGYRRAETLDEERKSLSTSAAGCLL